MDSLRITLLVIGIVFVALIYAWERIKRRKDETKYARWGGVDEEVFETPAVGRNSGDLETDSTLRDDAYDIDRDTSYSEVIEDVADTDDDWQAEVEASLEEESQQVDRAVEDNAFDVDLDSDPELDVDPIEDITTELEALEEIISTDQEPSQIELGDLDVPVDEPDAVTKTPDRVIVIHVLAREGAVFSGPDILSSLMHLGMQYGDMNVFHCLGTNNKSIFSLVNAVEPGIFDLSEMDDMTTPALLLMMTIPNPLPALEAYDGMLETARSLTASLDGRLCDETRSVLTRQAIDELRAELASL